MWTGIRINVPDGDAEDVVVQLLMNAGCNGVAIGADEPQRSVTSYIVTDENTPTKLSQISAAIALLPSLGVDDAEMIISQVNEEDWANSWKAYFKPIRIGRHIVVSPPWETPNLANRDILLTIDPGMAFGTGTHATTQLCLELLEDYLQPGGAVGDIGAGSGILAIAAAKLGAAEVTAVDNDPIAVRVAAQNAAVNGTKIDVSGSFPVGMKFDLVVANIIADTLIDLADDLASITKPEGIMVASGVIEDRQNDVRLFIEGAGFTSVETRTLGEWVALVFRRISD